MPSDDEVIEALGNPKPKLSDYKEEKERLDKLKEECKDFWRSPAGRKAVRNAR